MIADSSIGTDGVSLGILLGSRQVVRSSRPAPGRTSLSPATADLDIVTVGSDEPVEREADPAAPQIQYRDSSLTSRTASSPHRCPGPSTSPTNARAADVIITLREDAA